MTKIRHPFIRLLMWHPLFAAIPLAYVSFTAYKLGFPTIRTAGALIIALWFVLSVIDLCTSHRLLDAMYADEA